MNTITTQVLCQCNNHKATAEVTSHIEKDDAKNAVLLINIPVLNNNSRKRKSDTRGLKRRRTANNNNVSLLVHTIANKHLNK